jgi:hypothetical protein
MLSKWNGKHFVFFVLGRFSMSKPFLQEEIDFSYASMAGQIHLKNKVNVHRYMKVGQLSNLLYVDVLIV